MCMYEDLYVPCQSEQMTIINFGMQCYVKGHLVLNVLGQAYAIELNKKQTGDLGA